MSAEFRRVVGNASWNLVGNVLPLFAAAVAMPYLAQRLGTAQFGLLTLGWVLIGYFGLFDFGVGRALTKLVAEHSANNAMTDLPALCSTGVAVAGVAGLLGAALIAGLSSWGAAQWFATAPNLQSEAATGLLVIALGIPPTVGTAAFRGILEGFQRFKLLTAIRVPAGVLMFVAPCIAVAYTPRLDYALLAMVVTRWLVLLAHWWPCTSSVRLELSLVRPSWLASLLKMGGWLTVSNVVGPVIVYLDRFIIGASLSALALAYYAAPFELVSRLLVLPVALAGALFPALAAAQHQSLQHSQTLRRKALQLTLLGVVPMAVLGAVFAQPLLQAWMGPEFAEHGSQAMQILLVGFVFNAAAQIPLAALHGHGLARQTALLHLGELLPYVACLAFLVKHHGIDGAAVAWALRGCFDMLALSWLLRRFEQSRTGPSKMLAS
jgi:O-antigen/teichoic acid export membrane protein